ncbi:sporulation protein YqfD [Paenibacillus sp. CAA11]|uniref:sporulation protein YqfD n=1 Tax=Paenibacillus sp. CAA11 TaxID=1532905 RepID=UPI000D343A0E|nr:sporulation protein YqfD [Paenibacillus sp. CAA11]AWB45407.1 sporulation protein YqfD [Paenibacillus sp. CAA11]
MKTPILSALRGTVTISIRGGDLERLLNDMSSAGIEMWEVSPQPERKMVMSVRIADFLRLRPLLKQTGCRVHILRKRGLPFTAARLARRKLFAAGTLLFFAALYLMSSLVWDVEVKGNVSIPTEDIMNAAREEGLYPFQWKFKLEEQDKLSKSLTIRLPGTSWVGVTVNGTKATIEVVEATPPKKQELLDPRNLVSRADAVVSYIYAERGTPQVSKNDRVRKGEVLISGIQGNQTVVAKGEVRGAVWHEYKIEAPLVVKQKVFTGQRKQRGYLYFGETAVQISGYGKSGFDQSESLSTSSPLSWRSWKLPIGWRSETEMETTVLEIPQTEEEAKARGLEQAKRDIIAKYGPDAKVLEQKILHENTENGKVYMKVLFEVDQNIVQEVPIVQNQGE